MSKFFTPEEANGVEVRPFEYDDFTTAEEKAGGRTYVFEAFDGSDVDLTPDSAEHTYEFTPFAGDPEHVAKTLDEARAEAEKTIARAEAEAEGIRAEAEEIKKEAAKLRAEARDLGWEEGVQEGREQGRIEAKEAFEKDVEPLLEGLARVNDLYQELWRVNEPVLVELAVKTAEKIVLEEIRTHPDTIRSAFKAAVDQLHEQHEAVFRVHPDDLQHLESLRDEIRERIQGLVNLQFETDETLSRGDLVMETESGRLDATVRRRIEAVTSAVEETLQQSWDLDW